MFCNRCGKELEEDIKFCPLCGEAVVKEEDEIEEVPELVAIPEPKTLYIFCPNCGSRLEAGTVFCEVCGSKVDDAVIPPNLPENPPKKKKKRGIFIGAVAVVLVALIAVGGIFVVRGIQKGDEVIYFKQEALSGKKANSPKSEATVYDQSGMSTSEGDSILDKMEENGDYKLLMDIMAQKTEDGKYLFYVPGGSSDYIQGLTLSCRDLSKKETNADAVVKIDNDILAYYLLDDNRIVYIKGENLYIHDRKEKQKVASGVSSTYYVNEDQTQIMWIRSDGGLFYRDLSLKEEPVKIDSDVTEICSNKVDYADSFSLVKEMDFNKFYYLKGDGPDVFGNVTGQDLYVCTKLEKAEQIDSEVKLVNVPEKNAEGIYYIKDGKEEQLEFVSYVDDDMSEADMNMEEPERSDYAIGQSSSRQGSFEIDEEAYDKAWEDYEAKLKRDELRVDLLESEDAATTERSYELYYYKAGKSELVDENCLSVDAVHACQNGAALYSSYNVSDIPMVKISEVEELSEIGEMIGASRRDNVTAKLAQGTEIRDIGMAVSDVCENSEDDKFYFIEKPQEASEEVGAEGGKLYSLGYDSENIGELEEVGSNVRHILASEAGVPYYVDDEGNCYYGDTLVSDIFDNMFEDEKIDGFLVSTDVDKKNAYGTLSICKKGKLKKIADDVSYYQVISDKKIALLTGYSFTSMSGDLKMYTGKKELETLDSEVNAILNSNPLVYREYSGEESDDY